MPIEKFEQQLGTKEDLSKLDDAKLKEKEEKITKLESEIKEAAKTPKHNEMEDVHDGGKRETKWNVAEDTLDKAFRDLGIEDFDLTKVKKLEQDETPDFNKDREKGRPQIYYKQVMVEKPRGIIQKLRDRKAGRGPEMIPSDQVLVIVNMNNGENPNENTVVTMLCKQKDGKLDKSDGTALNTLESEEEFLKLADLKNTSSDARYRRGELTTQEYRKVYKKETGHTIEKYWQDWDKNVVKTVEYHKSEKLKAALMERLNEDYTRILTETQQRKEEIIRETEKRLKEKNEQKAKLLNDLEFTLLLEQLYQLQKSRNPKDIERMKKMRELFAKAFPHYNWDQLWEKDDLMV